MKNLVNDINPKTSQVLRFASQIIGLDPSIFYIPAQEAVITQITNEKEKIAYAQAMGQNNKQEVHR